MTKTMNFAIYFLLVFIQVSLFGQSSFLNNQVIEKIEVNVYAGSGTVSDSNSILARISTKQGGFFSQAEFDEDLKTLAQDFDRIEPSIETIDQKIYITLNLWPKPIIRSIEWQGNRGVETRRLQRELGINCFAIFERQAFNQAFHKLRAYYLRKGFFEAQLDYRVSLDCETNQVDIVIDIQEGRSGKIEEIVFINFSECEQHEILQQMFTKKYNFFTSWFNQEGIYNEEAIQQDQLIITNYLQNEGFADAQVDITVTEACTKDRIIVTITADRGEQYLLGKLSFDGNCIICSEEIDRLFLVRPGMPFSFEKLLETIQVIQDAYGRIGYIDAIIDFEPQLAEGQCCYDVHFKIEEGNLYRVGLIKVIGNLCTKTPVILHEIRLTPGDIFNSVKLKKTEQRLKNIGYFKNVNVYIAKGTESNSLPGNYRDVYVEVEETGTGQFSAFLGYSSVEELFGGISIVERNFNHEGLYYFGRDGLCGLRGGGEFASASAQIGQKSRTYALSWTKPYFMDTKWIVGFDLSKSTTRYISKEYDLDTVSLILRAQYNINDFVRTGFHYRLKNGKVDLHLDGCGKTSYGYDTSPDCSSTTSFNSSWFEEQQGKHELREEARIHGLISAVGTFINYDSTDSVLKPTRGFRSRLNVEFAGVGGDHTFFSVGYFNSLYYPVGSRLVIKYRADIRFIQPIGNTRYDTMPLDERIFLGGDFTVRGYRPYRIGPQYTGTHIPRGGLSMQLYSVEFNRQIMRNIEVFTFLDAGHLSKDTWEFGRLSVALGYGTRFKLIESIPQITVGMGYPLNPKNRSEVKKFFISVGGNF